MKNFFIVFALAVAGGASYLLYLDYHQNPQTVAQTSPPLNKESIGLVQNSRNNTLVIGAEVFSKDSVKTGDDSDVAVQLNNKTLIQIKSDSEVYLEKSGPGVSVTLQSGNIVVDNSNSSVQFVTRGAIISGEGSMLQVSTDATGKSTVTAQKNQAKLLDKNNKAVTLTENESANLVDGVIIGTSMANAAVTTATLPIPKQNVAKVLSTPAPHVAAKSSPPLSRKVAPKPLIGKVEIKKSSTPSPTPSPSPSVSPSPSATPSASPTPAIDKGPTFVILSPKDQTELTRDLTLPRPDPVLFQWQVTKPLPGPLVLTVSHDPQFSDPIVVNNLKKNSVAMILKKEGIYYWNLSSQSIDGSALEISPAITFNLKSGGALTAPTPLSPKNNELLESEEAKVITFKWKAAKNSTEYHLVVKRTDPATKEQFIVVDQNLPDTAFTTDPLELGTYTWMVTAKDIKGREKNFGRELNFNIGAPPQIAPPKLKDPVVK